MALDTFRCAQAVLCSVVVVRGSVIAIALQLWRYGEQAIAITLTLTTTTAHCTHYYFRTVNLHARRSNRNRGTMVGR